MPRIISNEERDDLLTERKQLPSRYETRLAPVKQSSSCMARRQFSVVGDEGHSFEVFVRRNMNWAEDFSIGLIFIDEDNNRYILTRYNGASHKHTNHLERQAGEDNHTFRDQFHIHVATERYQRGRGSIDGYAEPTSRFNSFESALDAFLKGTGFVTEASDGHPRPDPQQSLPFPE